MTVRDDDSELDKFCLCSSVSMGASAGDNWGENGGSKWGVGDITVVPDGSMV